MSGVFAGYLHTVGLHEDGTVVAVSDDSRGQCEVSSWRSITSVAAGSVHTLALSPVSYTHLTLPTILRV